MTKRALAKMRTRESLLAAARKLFSERGYEDATVRDIARAADLSTGAVFANFRDKEEMFGEILDADNAQLVQVMRQVMGLRDGNVRETLLGVLAAAYVFHLGHVRLLQAQISRSWRHDPEAEAAERGRQLQVASVIQDILHKGVAQGELASGLDLEIASDLIWQAYQSNLRFAAFDGFELGDLTGRLERQVNLLLPGMEQRKAA